MNNRRINFRKDARTESFEKFRKRKILGMRVSRNLCVFIVNFENSDRTKDSEIELLVKILVSNSHVVNRMQDSEVNFTAGGKSYKNSPSTTKRKKS